MNDTPRRIHLDKLTPAELAIHEAVQAVEEVGADPRLTDAVILLQEAREKVADYVDGVERDQEPPPERAYMPSHWRETLTDPEVQSIVGVTKHPHEAEDWVEVEIRDVSHD